MKGCLVAYPESGGYWPDWTKMHDHAVGRVYYCALKPIPDPDRPGHEIYVANTRQVSPEYRKGTNDNHFVYGVLHDPSWYRISDPAVLVAEANADILRAGADRAVCPYIFDIEYHDPHFVAETIRLWRKIRPTRLTAWTMEPFQGGWFTQELVDRINGDPNLIVLPQNYFGNMQGADAMYGAALRQDIVGKGVQPWRVKVFFDAALPLPPNWDGVLFSEERLPALHTGLIGGWF